MGPAILGGLCSNHDLSAPVTLRAGEALAEKSRRRANEAASDLRIPLEDDFVAKIVRELVVKVFGVARLPPPTI